MFSRFLSQLWRSTFSELPHIKANVLEVRSFEYLKAAMDWSHDPILIDEDWKKFQYHEDLNGRRLHDAMVIGGACRNGAHKTLLEIGTSFGKTTSLMAINAPDARIHTINIPPEEIAAGGTNVTFAPTKEEIGSDFKKRGLTNIHQIYANTATWIPDIGAIDIAFIDGCHDADFVYGDTRKVLANCQPGSLILWHDFSPTLRHTYPWIQEVLTGVNQLYEEKLLSGKILHLQDSWIGIYRVLEADLK